MPRFVDLKKCFDGHGNSLLDALNLHCELVLAQVLAQEIVSVKVRNALLVLESDALLV